MGSSIAREASFATQERARPGLKQRIGYRRSTTPSASPKTQSAVLVDTPLYGAIRGSARYSAQARWPLYAVAMDLSEENWIGLLGGFVGTVIVAVLIAWRQSKPKTLDYRVLVNSRLLGPHNSSLSRPLEIS